MYVYSESINSLVGQDKYNIPVIWSGQIIFHLGVWKWKVYNSDAWKIHKCVCVCAYREKDRKTQRREIQGRKLLSYSEALEIGKLYFNS